MGTEVLAGCHQNNVAWLYLKNSFIVLLTASFRQAGLILDATDANLRIGYWLSSAANMRRHDTTGVSPEERIPTRTLVIVATAESYTSISFTDISDSPDSYGEPAASVVRL